MEKNKCKTCGWFKEYHPPIKENYVGEGDCNRYPAHVRKSSDSCCGEHTDLRRCEHVFKDLKRLKWTGYGTDSGEYDFIGVKCLVCGLEVLDEKK